MLPRQGTRYLRRAAQVLRWRPLIRHSHAIPHQLLPATRATSQLAVHTAPLGRAAARRYARPTPSSHIDCPPSGLERALLALPQSGAPPPCVRHAATSHARCASSRAQGRSLVARGDDQRCGQAATDWMRCVTRPAHTAPQYASTLCVNQAATGCELQAAERPTAPCYRTRRPSERVPIHCWPCRRAVSSASSI